MEEISKLIFLDVDGVLATPSTLKNGRWELSNQHQKILGLVLEKTNAKIVLSSSWRKDTLEETKEFMQSKGFMFVEEIIGITIRAHKFIDTSHKIHLSIPRGVEIKQWIDTNIHERYGRRMVKKSLGRDYNFVIIDDKNNMLLEHMDNLILTNTKLGLTIKDALIAIEKLNRVI